jgi:hypothetical protein
MKWCYENTAVTDIHIDLATMRVTLSAEKYTTTENVESIAVFLARAYCMQTGALYVNCRIYLGGSEYASGSFRK